MVKKNIIKFFCNSNEIFQVKKKQEKKHKYCYKYNKAASF